MDEQVSRQRLNKTLVILSLSKDLLLFGSEKQLMDE